MALDKLLASLTQARQEQTKVDAELRQLVSTLNAQFRQSPLSGQTLKVAKDGSELSWNYGHGFVVSYSQKRLKFESVDAEGFLIGIELLPALLAQLIMSERAIANSARETLMLSQTILSYSALGSKGTPVTAPASETDSDAGRFNLIG